MACFNPRTRVGCDSQSQSHANNVVFQSTHPCGVRQQLGFRVSGSYGFNPRTRVGCDFVAPGCAFAAIVSIHAPVWGATGSGLIVYTRGRFQSTHPCGVRLVKSMSFCQSLCFNPRTRVGCDKSVLSEQFGSDVSIHAPVWGAT